MMLKGLTAQYLLKKTLPQEGLQAGDFVLFHAAAGGVGLIACQWAHALGLQLIGTAGSDAKCALALRTRRGVSDRLHAARTSSPASRRSPAARASRWSTTRSARTPSSAASTACARSA